MKVVIPLNKIGAEVKDQIIEILKSEINYTAPFDDYSQWLMGASINKNRTDGSKEAITYTTRTVVKTNKSNYVDGMDINFTQAEGKLAIDPLFYENSPDLMGSPEKDAIEWIFKAGNIDCINLIDPHQEELYLERLKHIVYEYSFNRLDEYYDDNSQGKHGKKIIVLYQDILQEALLGKVIVEGEGNIQDSYKIKAIFKNRAYTLNLKPSFTKEQVIEEIRQGIILAIVNGHEDEEYKEEE